MDILTADTANPIKKRLTYHCKYPQDEERIKQDDYLLRLVNKF